MSMKRGAEDMSTGGSFAVPEQNKRRAMESNRSLMVNYLPKGLTEPMLRELFESFGEIERVKLITDAATGQSKCYGFVHFTDPAAAASAIQRLHGHEIEGKKLRVAYSNDGSAQKSGGGGQNLDVFFSGFGPKFAAEQLRALAADYGTVLDAKVLDPAKHPRGVGFVKFAQKSQADTCIASLNGLEFPVNGTQTQLIVKYAKQKGEGSQQQQQQQLGMLGGFGAAGLQGFDPSLQLLALQGLQHQQMNPLLGLDPFMMGMQQQLYPNINSAAGTSGTTLFVRGFIEANEPEVMSIFRPHGAIRVDIPKDENQRPRNFCFVHFPTPQMAQAAIQATDGTLTSTGRTLQVKFRGTN